MCSSGEEDPLGSSFPVLLLGDSPSTSSLPAWISSALTPSLGLADALGDDCTSIYRYREKFSVALPALILRLVPSQEVLPSLTHLCSSSLPPSPLNTLTQAERAMLNMVSSCLVD